MKRKKRVEGEEEVYKRHNSCAYYKVYTNVFHTADCYPLESYSHNLEREREREVKHIRVHLTREICIVLVNIFSQLCVYRVYWIMT